MSLISKEFQNHFIPAHKCYWLPRQKRKNIFLLAKCSLGNKIEFENYLCNPNWVNSCRHYFTESHKWVINARVHNSSLKNMIFFSVINLKSIPEVYVIFLVESVMLVRISCLDHYLLKLISHSWRVTAIKRSTGNDTRVSMHK